MRARVSDPLESSVEQSIKRWCQRNGVWTKKFVSVSNGGVPDRVYAKAGKVIWIETKRLKTKTSALQDYEIAEMHKVGLSVFVAQGFADAVGILEREFLVGDCI